MKKTQLLLFLLLFCSMFTGCFYSVEVKPASFDHKDEILRKGDFVILADRRIFATMAFLNATGFDVEIQGMQMHPVRQIVRQKLKENAAEHPEKFQDGNDITRKPAALRFIIKILP